MIHVEKSVKGFEVMMSVLCNYHAYNKYVHNGPPLEKYNIDA